MPISNPVAFIGEQVLGSTVGAPLSADANGQLVSGITASEVNATASTTTTSATDVLIDTMTSTPVAGTYLVHFQTTLQSNTNNATFTVSIYSGGSQVTGTEMSAIPQIQGGVTPSLNINIPISSMCLATVNGSQAIEARWRRSAGTATALSRRMTIVRIS